MYLTVFLKNDPPYTVNLEKYGKNQVTFGRAPTNDIVLSSRIVSSAHGMFVKEQGVWKVVDRQSLNGLFINEEAIQQWRLSDGLKIYIGSEEHSDRVIFVCSMSPAQDNYQHYRLGADVIRIGRQADCEIPLAHMSVSRVHARLFRRGREYFIRPEGNSVIRYNGYALGREGRRLSPMDRFMIGDTTFLYRAGELVYYRKKNGCGIEVTQLTKRVKADRGQKVIVDSVSFQIQPGELVAIVGGSGAGKSSVMKCISGCTRFQEGTVLIQGENIKTGFESLKKMIGYVPQQDIVYDDLTLERMLYYSARLRMQDDVKKEEIQERIQSVLQMLELTGHEKTMIRSLSGGQKKRASIAVELLSDPGIFFLDEPTSGLDPGTEKNLMHTLKKMTERGKTVILVTHTPLNLDLCDKILFMGRGGRLCFFGSPAQTRKFFGVRDLVDVYNLVSEHPEEWRKRYDHTQTPGFRRMSQPAVKKEKKKASSLRQMGILASRYIEIIWNDKKKLAMQLLMAPGLGLFLYIAFHGSMHAFEAAGDTEKFALSLACCSFWIGLFQAIQEVCKERTIMERERMAGLKSGAYQCSKILVLGGFIFVQSLLLLGVVWTMIGHPEEGMVLVDLPFLEYLITTYLTAFSAAMMGLLTSAIVSRSDQAVMAAPLLLIPQILFSQIICSLSGAAEKISWIVSCQWACLAYGASADINALPAQYGTDTSSLLAAGLGEDTVYNSRYTFEGAVLQLSNPIPKSWMALAVICILLIAATYLALRRRQEL
ncbi:MAG: ATP-binding cassette domain-containing protein [Clostridiales bacterium]|nr:ATP-binding cassette domain-containing protein [Clostridiales bacterium]